MVSNIKLAGKMMVALLCLLAFLLSPVMSLNENQDADTLHETQPQADLEKLEDKAEASRSSGMTTAENEDDDFPHGIKLALLTLALCLSVFLVCLVSQGNQL